MRIVNKVALDIAVSLDGYIAGPNDEYFGLNDWFFAPAGPSREVVEESLQTTGAIIMGRRTYDIGAAQNAFADNPYQAPHFVLSHTVPDTRVAGAEEFIFGSDLERLLKQAQAAARDKTVVIGGGAKIAQQFLQAGLVEEVQLHLSPVLIGDGIRLFEGVGLLNLETTRVIEGTGVTHLKFRVIR